MGFDGIYSLVGGDWNMTFIFPSIEGIIIPIDFHIFQMGSNHQPDIFGKLFRFSHAARTYPDVPYAYASRGSEVPSVSPLVPLKLQPS